MEETFLFYTYNSAGEDVVISIDAPSRELAIARFDDLYGIDTLIDSVVKKSQVYPG